MNNACCNVLSRGTSNSKITWESSATLARSLLAALPLAESHAFRVLVKDTVNTREYETQYHNKAANVNRNDVKFSRRPKRSAPPSANKLSRDVTRSLRRLSRRTRNPLLRASRSSKHICAIVLQPRRSAMHT